MGYDAKPHLLTVRDDGEKTFEIDHPGCPTELVEMDTISGDREAAITYERHTCRLQWVVDYWGLDFLQHRDGTQGWLSLEPGHYTIVSFNDGGDEGVELLDPLPVSDKIVMRPTWERRQRRHHLQAPLDAPTEREIQDAIRVLEDAENQELAPALYLEAFTIMDEASEPKEN